MFAVSSAGVGICQPQVPPGSLALASWQKVSGGGWRPSSCAAVTASQLAAKTFFSKTRSGGWLWEEISPGPNSAGGSSVCLWEAKGSIIKLFGVQIASKIMGGCKEEKVGFEY